MPESEYVIITPRNTTSEPEYVDVTIANENTGPEYESATIRPEPEYEAVSNVVKPDPIYANTIRRDAKRPYGK